MTDSMQERRRQRALSGSKRKRDLEAAGLPTPPRRSGERWQRDADRQAEQAERERLVREQREARQRPRIEATEASRQAWPEVRGCLERAVPASTFALWLAPIACIGEVDGALCLEAPAGAAAWVERRYGGLLGEAVRRDSDYRGAFLFRAPPEEEEGLL